MTAADSQQPLYQKIYLYLLQAIKKGDYRPGDRVPSEKELSRQFNVSRITSKRALELLSSEGKIERIPGKGSFIPMPAGAAGTPRTGAGRSETLIGCVMADFDDSFGARLLQGFERGCSERGFQIVLHFSRNVESEKEAIDRLLDAGVRAIVIMPCHGEHYNAAILRLVLDNYPLVLVDRNLRGLAASSVATDNVAAAKSATDRLIGAGHRSICFISSPPAHTSTIEERLEGFIRSHAEHGIPVDQELRLEVLVGVRPPHFWVMSQVVGDVARIAEHLGAHPEITAVLASEFSIACLVESAVKRLGKRIPDDISIICFDNPDRFDVEPRFAHMKQKDLEIGTTAAELACGQVSGQSDLRQVRLPAEFIAGPSIAPPRTGK